MKHKSFFQFPLSLFALVFVLGSCGEAPKQLSMQEHYGYSFAENDNSILYEISGNGLKTPSYLYGTIHIQRKEVFDFDTLVMQLYDTCQAYAMEVAMDEVNPMKAAKMMALEKPLDSLISPEKFAKLDSIYEAETGSRLGMMKMTKPFFLIAQLMAEDIGGDMDMALKRKPSALKNSKNKWLQSINLPLKNKSTSSSKVWKIPLPAWRSLMNC
jgi:hypothetical protein